MNPQGFLAAVRARLRRVIVLDGVARVIAWTLLVAAVVIALDYHWRLPGAVRLLALLAIVTTAVWLIRRRLVRPLAQPMDDRALAQFVERRLPQLDGRLLTAVDGIDLGDEAVTLQGAMVPGATAALVPARQLPRRLALAISVLVALAGVAAFAPRFLSEACGRLLLPLGDTDWTRTAELSAHLEKTVVAADEKLVVMVSRTRGRDAALRLAWTDPLTHQEEDRQLPGLGGPWRQALALPPGEHDLTITSGDARPLVLHGRVVTRPVLAAVTATLTPPAYLSAPAQQLSTLTCSALPGSVLSFELTLAAEPDRTLTAANVTAPGKNGPEALTLTRDTPPLRDNRHLRGSFTVWTSGQLTVTAVDQDGIAMQPLPQFAITAAEDRVPVVALSGPSRNEAVTMQAQLAVAIEASDDHALASLVLGAQLALAKPADGPEPAPTNVELVRFGEIQGAAATSRSYTLIVGEQAKLGATLALQATATDTNTVTGPGIGRSEPLTLRVVTPEELRAELDRLLGEAKDRVVQAREEIGGGLAKPERLAVVAKSAGLTAQKSSAVLEQVLRRWRENRLPAEQILPAAQARTLIDATASPQLVAAIDGGDLPARAADAALAQAEKLLASLLQDGDLTRLLTSLIGKETSLAEESRAFVKEHLTKPMDDAAKTRQTNLAERQKEIAAQLKEVERRVLGSAAPQLAPAQDLVRKEGPGDKLAQAGADLGSAGNRPAAIDKQKAGLDSMKKMLELLRGNDAAGDLAKQVGALAAAEEAIAGALDAGARPQDQQPPQQDVAAKTKKLIDDVAAKDPQAGKLLRAAADAQAAADQAMGAGDRAGSSQQAGAAAALLREAQKQLGGDPAEDNDPKKQQRSADVLALLKELYGLQSRLVADASDLHRRIGDKDLDFAAQREAKGMAARQGDVLLRVREEVLKLLDPHPIAKVAVHRVAAAMDRAVQHLDQPAMGEVGMRLELIALSELRRLLAMAENQPSPDKQGGGGGGGGGGQSPAFPPSAEIALLAGMQNELAALTAAGRPVDLAAGQEELRKLVEGLEAAGRPGSRANLLLARTRRAMASAGALLGAKDHGSTTRNEQGAAEDTLRRLLAEADGQGGGGGGGQSGRNKPQPKGAPPAGGEPQPQPQPGGGAAAGGNPANTKPGTGGAGVTAKVDGAEKGLMELSPEKREQLKQARQEHLSPRAFQLYQRYLELLEGK